MRIVHRKFATDADLGRVGLLIRRCWRAAPRFNAWTFARFDIWAQRRIAAAELDGETAWQDDIGLWLGADDELVAAAFIGEDAGDGVLVLGLPQLDLVPDLLGFVEEHARAPLLVEVNESNEALRAVVAERGYELIDGHFIPRAKLLGMVDGDVPLPDGYRIETLRDDDIPRYHDAVHAVFSRGGTDDALRIVRRAPSFVEDLGLIAVDEKGTVVSFACVWVDRELGVCEFEPVGTRPSHQRLGLASALMVEAENRLRRLGVPLATVHSWSESAGANRLYDRLAYEAVDRQQNWRRA